MCSVRPSSSAAGRCARVLGCILLVQGALSSTHTSHADPTYFDAWAAPAPGSQARLVTRLPLASDGPFAGLDAWDSLPKDAQHSLSGNDSAALGTAAGVGVLPVRLGKHPREWLPNVFSGVTRDDSDDAFLTFIGISDRGPVSHCGAEDAAKNFVWPHYSPTTYQLRVDPASPRLDVVASCPLKVPAPALSASAPASARSRADEPPATGAAGLGLGDPQWAVRGVTGLPNTANDDVPYADRCTRALDRDPNGLDSEDIQKIPGSPYCLGVDEYSPSLFVFNCDFTSLSCGDVLVRYVPEGIDDAQFAAEYNVSAILPRALLQRRRSRGFEGLAISPDGSTAIAVMQSAMGDAHGAQKHSQVVLAVTLNVTQPLAASLVTTQVILTRDAHAWAHGADGRSKTRPRDIKISAASWVGHLMGRPADPVILLLVRGVDQVLAQAADFTHATDVTQLLAGDPLALDSLGNRVRTHLALRQLQVHHAHTHTFLDSGDLSAPDGGDIAGLPNGVRWSDKQEAMTIVNNCTLAFGNDNDFTRESEFWVIQLPRCLSAGMKSEHARMHPVLFVLLGLVIAVVGFGLVIHAATRYNPQQQYEPVE